VTIKERGIEGKGRGQCIYVLTSVLNRSPGGLAPRLLAMESSDVLSCA
jgi:hypothetical protein